MVPRVLLAPLVLSLFLVLSAGSSSTCNNKDEADAVGLLQSKASPSTPQIAGQLTKEGSRRSGGGSGDEPPPSIEDATLLEAESAEGSYLQVVCQEDEQWHPDNSAGWTAGYCRFTVDCDTPGYSTQLACCKAAYAGQISGFCLSQVEDTTTQAS